MTQKIRSAVKSVKKAVIIMSHMFVYVFFSHVFPVYCVTDEMKRIILIAANVSKQK